MLKTTIVRTATVIACLSVLSATAIADTKVKSRQTSGGQTYENTSYIKGKRQRSETNNGGMITIQQCDLRRNIQLMPQAQVYMIQPYDQPSTSTDTNSTTTPASQPVKKGGVDTSIVTTKDTGERKQMFGYTARHIITTMEMKSSPDACSQTNMKMEIDGWYIDAAFALDCDSNHAYTNYKRPASGGCQDRYETKTIGMAKKGYPVWEKTTMFGPNGTESFSTLNEVIEFSQATLDQSLFEIPEGYREVEDFASAFSAAYATSGAGNMSETSGAASTMSTATQPAAPPANAVGPKREGVIRFGVPAAKSGNVAEWMNAQNLAAAVQNTLVQNLNGTNVEAVVIEATGAGIQAEAQQKQCDYIVFASVSHKKGGGGFGSMLSSSVGQIASNVGYGSGTAAVIATNTVVAATVAQNIKAKDELTLDVRLERPTSTTPSFAQTFKGKAKSAGEDIITPASQQAAQAIIASVGKQ